MLHGCRGIYLDAIKTDQVEVETFEDSSMQVSHSSRLALGTESIPKPVGSGRHAMHNLPIRRGRSPHCFGGALGDFPGECIQVSGAVWRKIAIWHIIVTLSAYGVLDLWEPLTRLSVPYLNLGGQMSSKGQHRQDEWVTDLGRTSSQVVDAVCHDALGLGAPGDPDSFHTLERIGNKKLPAPSISLLLYVSLAENDF